MNPAVLATFGIAIAFAVAAGWGFYTGGFWAGTMNTGLTITNFAWAMLQRS